ILVLDEAHKLRNLYGVDPPPQVALRFKDALEKRRFRYVLMLTATPIQNRLWDLYSLVDVARGHQNPFGREGMFAPKFIAGNREAARPLMRLTSSCSRSQRGRRRARDPQIGRSTRAPQRADRRRSGVVVRTCQRPERRRAAR